MNLDILSKSIVYQKDLNKLFQIIKAKIHNNFLLGYLSENEKSQIDSNWKNLTLKNLEIKLINEKPEIYWKMATEIIANVSITDASFLLNENLFYQQSDFILENAIFEFIDVYFDKMKNYIQINKLYSTIRFFDQLKKYCKLNFEKMHNDLISFCVLVSTVKLSSYGKDIWKIYEEDIFKDYFSDKFSNDYIIFWSTVLRNQRVPNAVIKKMIPNFVKFYEIRHSICTSSYSDQYLTLFENTKWSGLLRNQEKDHR